MLFELFKACKLKTYTSKIMKILVLNPGSTSTKVAIFEDEKQIEQKIFKHSPDELAKFKTLWEQFDFRLRIILDFLKEKNFKPSDFSAVVGIGGLLRPVRGGTYRVNEKMLEDAKNNFQGEHPSNLGCALAYEIAKIGGVEAFTVDPVSVDEFEPLARYSGHPLIQRRSLSHALNIHATARIASEKIGKRFEEANFVIAHLGGGISVCPVKGGKIIDANDASSDGPFSPERTGGLPLQPFITLCFSGKYTESEIRKMVMGKGGLVAYLGTNDASEVERRINSGDKYAREVYEAMAYQIAKEIGAMSTVLKGKIDAIVLTGGLANSKMLVDWIIERVSFIAPVLVFPGEDEMRALALGVLRVLKGEEQALEYPGH
jgi:butyrate kinase